MNKTIVGTGSGLGLLAVVLGALGAHALREQISPASLESYQTGVQYQMYHALFLLFLGLNEKLPEPDRKWIFRFIAAGVLCFSGSIYALSTSALTGVDFKAIGWVTPLGGLFFITGWAWLIFRVLRNPS